MKLLILAFLVLFSPFPPSRKRIQGGPLRQEVLKRVRGTVQTSAWLHAEVLSVRAAQELRVWEKVLTLSRALGDVDAKLGYLADHIRAGRNVKWEGVKTRQL